MSSVACVSVSQSQCVFVFSFLVVTVTCVCGCSRSDCALHAFGNVAPCGKTVENTAQHLACVCACLHLHRTGATLCAAARSAGRNAVTIHAIRLALCFAPLRHARRAFFGERAPKVSIARSDCNAESVRVAILEACDALRLARRTASIGEMDTVVCGYASHITHVRCEA